MQVELTGLHHLFGAAPLPSTSIAEKRWSICGRHTVHSAHDGILLAR